MNYMFHIYNKRFHVFVVKRSNSRCAFEAACGNMIKSDHRDSYSISRIPAHKILALMNTSNIIIIQLLLKDLICWFLFIFIRSGGGKRGWGAVECFTASRVDRTFPK